MEEQFIVPHYTEEALSWCPPQGKQRQSSRGYRFADCVAALYSVLECSRGLLTLLLRTVSGSRAALTHQIRPERPRLLKEYTCILVIISSIFLYGNESKREPVKV